MEILSNQIGFYKFKSSKNKSKGTIVFVHGFATNSDYHDEAAEMFDDYDYYALELPGSGYTELSDINNFDLNTFVNFCVSMIEALQLNDIFLMGHSMGGSLVMRIAGIIAPKIQKLILITPMNSSITLNSFKFFFLFTPKSFNKTLSLNNVLYKDLTKTINLDIENYISKEHQYQIKHLVFFKKLKNKLYSIKNVKNCSNAEKLLSIPTLLIVGEFDKTIPYKPAIRAIKKSNKPFIQVSIFRESAHVPFQEEPIKYLKEVTDFLEN